MKRSRLIIILAYVAVLAAALIVRYKPSYWAADLLPLPDALEYSVTGVQLFLGHPYAMPINHVPYPPNYPYGFPLLLVPAFAIFGPVAHYAIYASLFYSMALLVLTMFLTQRFFGHVAALVAGAVVATAQQQIVTSGEIMSDAVAVALVFLAAYQIIRVGEGAPDLARLFAAGCMAGLILSMRYADVIQVASLGVTALIALRQTPRRLISGLAAYALGVGLLAVPLLAYLWQTFGSPFGNGYAYWNPLFNETGNVFSLSFLAPTSNEMVPPKIAYYSAMLLGGSGWFYLPPFVAAIVVGLAAIVRRASPQQKQGIAILGVLSLANLAIYSIYSFQYPRFIILAATALTIIGAHGVAEIWQYAATAAGQLRTLAAIALACILGGMVVSGDQALRGSYPYRAWVRHTVWWETPWRYETMRYLDEHLSSDAILISAVPAPYVEHYFIKDTGRMYVPIERKGAGFYAGKPPARDWITASDNADMLQSAIARGRPVYLMNDVLMNEHQDAMNRLRTRFDFQLSGEVHYVGRGAENKTVPLYRLVLRGG